MVQGAERGSRPLVVVEDDPFLRLVQVILDPYAPAEMVSGFADFMAHDEPDFVGWCERLRARVPQIWPARVEIVETPEEMRRALRDADLAIVESMPFGAEELAAGPRLRAVQKYGALSRNIDIAACKVRNVEVLTIRRRANLACAEHAFALMLAIARKIHTYGNVVSVGAMRAAGNELRPFARQFTPNGNWGRVKGLVSLHGTTIGIIGLGEIGREIALRARAFEMKAIYHQRRRLAEAEEQALGVGFRGLEQLLAESDWIVPQLPASAETRHVLDAQRLALVKRGAAIVNVSRPDVIEREALISALRSGRLGGLGLDPPYESPAREDDELLRLPNVVVTPHFAGSPRFNALDDFEEMITHLARVMASRENGDVA